MLVFFKLARIQSLKVLNNYLLPSYGQCSLGTRPGIQCAVGGWRLAPRSSACDLVEKLVSIVICFCCKASQASSALSEFKMKLLVNLKLTEGAQGVDACQVSCEEIELELL